MTSAPDTPTPRSVYRMQRAHFARSLGRLLLASAAAVLFTTLALQFLPGVFATAGVVVSTVLLVLAMLAAVSLMLPPTLLQLDDHGFRALKRQVAGPAHARWEDVKRVGTQTGEQGPVMMFEHADGRLTAVPLAVLDPPAALIEADVQRRLDQARGYRPLS